MDSSVTFSITAACSRRALVKMVNGEASARLQMLRASMPKQHLLGYFYFSSTQVRTVRHSYFSTIDRAICNTVHPTHAFITFLLVIFSLEFWVMNSKMRETPYSIQREKNKIKSMRIAFRRLFYYFLT